MLTFTPFDYQRLRCDLPIHMHTLTAPISPECSEAPQLERRPSPSELVIASRLVTKVPCPASFRLSSLRTFPSLHQATPLWANILLKHNS